MQQETRLEHADPCLEIRHTLHELAQPLAAVAGLVDLLLLQMDESDAGFYEVQMISQQLEKVLEIIGQIRRIAREATEAERGGLEPPSPLVPTG